MQQIIISGIVSSVPKQFTRPDGSKIILFYVSCYNNDSSYQAEKYSHYKCSYHVIDLKKGDPVFLVGTLRVGIHKDKNGEAFVNLFVRAEHLTLRNQI